MARNEPDETSSVSCLSYIRVTELNVLEQIECGNAPILGRCHSPAAKSVGGSLVQHNKGRYSYLC